MDFACHLKMCMNQNIALFSSHLPVKCGMFSYCDEIRDLNIQSPYINVYFWFVVSCRSMYYV